MARPKKATRDREKLSERHSKFYSSPNTIADQIYNGGLYRLSGARVGVTCNKLV